MKPQVTINVHVQDEYDFADLQYVKPIVTVDGIAITTPKSNFLGFSTFEVDCDVSYNVNVQFNIIFYSYLFITDDCGYYRLLSR